MNDVNVASIMNCEGYFGFGSGWAAQQVPQFKPVGVRGACEVCPVKARCLEKHRERVRYFFAAICATWDAIPENLGHDRREKMLSTAGAVFIQGPYQLVANGNTEDGVLVGLGDRPKQRGHMTIPYPIPAQS